MTESSIHRILDANLNRAREALRVMEEFARFRLEDPALTLALKEVRHALAHGVPEALRPALTSARDIAGDVGREVSTPSEQTRADIDHVLRAATRRLSEALRAIEEYGKTVAPAWAEEIERLRYRGYALEARLLKTLEARARWRDVRLYVLLTASFCKGDWWATAEAVLRGGADCLQLREPELPDGELLRRARRLAALCREHDALLIVNDRADVAALVGAGVHLGQDDLPVTAARRLLPATAVIGVSTHTGEQVAAVVESAPDYVAVGPMFPSTTKPRDHVAGPAGLEAARHLTGLPLVAIGGITPGNAEAVLSAAPCALAVCSAIIAQADPAAACLRFREIIDRAASA